MPPPPRVQLVISGKFITLFLFAASLLGAGYYWHSRQLQNQARVQQLQDRFKTPPYFVNRGASVIRSCSQCLETQGKLKSQGGWKVHAPQEIPVTEQHWFLAVEDPPLPVTVSGVLMLPVHPALKDNPTLGFDMTRVVLVLYQNLERRSSIEQPPPVQIPVPAPSEPPKPSPTETTEPDTESASRAAADDAVFKNLKSPFVGDWRNIDPQTRAIPRLLITGSLELAVHAWGRCHPSDCDWGEVSGVRAPPVDGSFRVAWDQGFAVSSLDLSLDRGKLRCLLRIHYTDKSGRRDAEEVMLFDRSPSLL